MTAPAPRRHIDLQTLMGSERQRAALAKAQREQREKNEKEVSK